MNYKEYRIRKLKTRKNQHCEIYNSYGTKDIYRWCRKHKLIDRNITEKDFRKIINGLNQHLQDQLLESKKIQFPERMGEIEIRKYKTFVKIKNGEIMTNLSVDWKKTLKLWYQDKEAEQNKTLIRKETEEKFKFVYNKANAVYNNKCFYKFTPTRDLKIKLKNIITTKGFDALLF